MIAIDSDKMVALVKHFGGCPTAVDWLTGVNNPSQAWRVCNRADWMDWSLQLLYEQDIIDYLDIYKPLECLAFYGRRGLKKYGTFNSAHENGMPMIRGDYAAELLREEVSPARFARWFYKLYRQWQKEEAEE